MTLFASLKDYVRQALLPPPLRGVTDVSISDRLGIGEGTWTCHVCGDERPDAQISVLSTYVRPPHWKPGWPPVQQNVRYCNDRPACIEGAKSVSLFK